MKKILLFSGLLLLLNSCATHTSFNSFYKKTHSESDFSLGLRTSLIRGFLPDEDLQEIKPLLKKAKHVRILVFSKNAEEMNAKFDKFIKKSKFESLIKLKEDNSKIDFYLLENKDKIKEIVLEISSDGNLVLLGLKTNIKQEDLDSLLN